MWFVFPQVRGLGRSPTAQSFAIGSLDEAREYLSHPVLGPRLVECTSALITSAATTAEEILGPVDAMKLRSSMTLFALAAPENRVFGELIDRFFDGQADPLTERILSAQDRD